MPRPKKVKEKKTRAATKAPREKKIVKVKKQADDFFSALVRETGNELASAASNGIAAGDA